LILTRGLVPRSVVSKKIAPDEVDTFRVREELLILLLDKPVVGTEFGHCC